MQVNMYGAANAARKRSAEQTAQQGDQGDTDEGNAAASHQLLHTLTLAAGVILSIALQQVDATPDTQGTAQTACTIIIPIDTVEC